jgi:hypothetical protein
MKINNYLLKLMLFLSSSCSEEPEKRENTIIDNVNSNSQTCTTNPSIQLTDTFNLKHIIADLSSSSVVNNRIEFYFQFVTDAIKKWYSK